jgi:hypothetical protein
LNSASLGFEKRIIIAFVITEAAAGTSQYRHFLGRGMRTFSNDEVIARTGDTRLLIQPNSGGGKSWLLRLIAERAGIKTIVLDYEGEFASLREAVDMLLVGANGELPADPLKGIMSQSRRWLWDRFPSRATHFAFLMSELRTKDVHRIRNTQSTALSWRFLKRRLNMSSGACREKVLPTAQISPRSLQ